MNGAFTIKYFVTKEATRSPSFNTSIVAEPLTALSFVSIGARSIHAA